MVPLSCRFGNAPHAEGRRPGVLAGLSETELDVLRVAARLMDRLP
ncbi:hypothetical protein [Actinomadura sp. NPDC049753]